MKDALTDDLLLISYSYTHGIPRFYTKSHALDPAFYLTHDVDMSLAAAATSATPFYFDPVFRPIFNNRKRDTEALIDGTIIANNPSLYAMMYAKHWRKKDIVRVVSIGFKKHINNDKDLEVMNYYKWY